MNRTRDNAKIGRTKNGEQWHFATDTCHLVDSDAFTSTAELTYVIETSTGPLGNQQQSLDIRNYALDDDDHELHESDICSACVHSKQKALFS